MKILILEDDVIWQLKLRMMLEELNMNDFEFIDNISQAHKKLKEVRPDLVIADVVLADGMSFELLNSHSRTFPVVYITLNPSQELLEKALSYPLSTFIVKPFHPLSFLAAVHSLGVGLSKNSRVPRGVWVIGKFKQKLLLSFDEICFIEADGNYVTVHTKEQAYTFKQTLKKIIEQIDNRFVRIHKSYIINTSYVKRVDLSRDEVVIEGKTLPIGRAYRTDSVKYLVKIVK